MALTIEVDECVGERQDEREPLTHAVNEGDWEGVREGHALPEALRDPTAVGETEKQPLLLEVTVGEVEVDGQREGGGEALAERVWV